MRSSCFFSCLASIVLISHCLSFSCCRIFSWCRRILLCTEPRPGLEAHLPGVEPPPDGEAPVLGVGHLVLLSIESPLAVETLHRAETPLPLGEDGLLLDVDSPLDAIDPLGGEPLLPSGIDVWFRRGIQWM